MQFLGEVFFREYFFIGLWVYSRGTYIDVRPTGVRLYIGFTVIRWNFDPIRALNTLFLIHVFDIPITIMIVGLDHVFVGT